MYALCLVTLCVRPMCSYTSVRPMSSYTVAMYSLCLITLCVRPMSGYTVCMPFYNPDKTNKSGMLYLSVVLG